MVRSAFPATKVLMTHQGGPGGESCPSDNRTPRIVTFAGVTSDFVMPYFLTDNYTHISFIATSIRNPSTYSSLLLRCHILATVSPSHLFSAVSTGRLVQMGCCRITCTNNDDTCTFVLPVLVFFTMMAFISNPRFLVRLR